MSLKQILHNRIKSYGGEMMPASEVEEMCKASGYKLSNGERRLRPSESSKEVETIYHKTENGKNDYIIGYRWRIKEEELKLEFKRDRQGQSLFV